MWKPVGECVLQPCRHSGETSRTLPAHYKETITFSSCSVGPGFSFCQSFFIVLCSCLFSPFKLFLFTSFLLFFLPSLLDSPLIFFYFPVFFRPSILSSSCLSTFSSSPFYLSVLLLCDEVLVDCSREQVQVSLLLLITSAHAVMLSRSFSLPLSLWNNNS